MTTPDDEVERDDAIRVMRFHGVSVTSTDGEDQFELTKDEMAIESVKLPPTLRRLMVHHLARITGIEPHLFWHPDSCGTDAPS